MSTNAYKVLNFLQENKGKEIIIKDIKENLGFNSYSNISRLLKQMSKKNLITKKGQTLEFDPTTNRTYQVNVSISFKGWFLLMFGIELYRKTSDNTKKIIYFFENNYYTEQDNMGLYLTDKSLYLIINRYTLQDKMKELESLGVVKIRNYNGKIRYYYISIAPLLNDFRGFI